MDIGGQILKWVGGFSLTTISFAGIWALATHMSKRFGEKWLDSKFDEKLQALRHAHDKELEDLRFKIATLLDRATKLHSREFEVLPESWSRLNDAFWQAMPPAGTQLPPPVGGSNSSHPDAVNRRRSAPS